MTRITYDMQRLAAKRMTELVAGIVYEMEWAMSRSGNYLRENSKPLFVVFADESISYGDEKGPDKEFKAVMQYPKGSSAQYITWAQAVENLNDYDTIKNLVLANGNKPVISQRESVEYLGWSADVDKTMEEMAGEDKSDLFEPTV